MSETRSLISFLSLPGVISWSLMHYPLTCPEEIMYFYPMMSYSTLGMSKTLIFSRTISNFTRFQLFCEHVCFPFFGWHMSHLYNMLSYFVSDVGVPYVYKVWPFFAPTISIILIAVKLSFSISNPASPLWNVVSIFRIYCLLHYLSYRTVFSFPCRSRNCSFLLLEPFYWHVLICDKDTYYRSVIPSVVCQISIRTGGYVAILKSCTDSCMLLLFSVEV